MTLLISGICGFVGSTLALALRAALPAAEIIGCDNFIRPGSETNREKLRRLGIRILHADVRSASDIAALPAAEWVIDAAALPSVTAGTVGRESSRQVVEHNLGGTINLLEYCRTFRAGFILLSTSRVYSIAPLFGLPLRVEADTFRLDDSASLPRGISPAGISEEFSTLPPVSLYGSTKIASEILALEYGSTFDLPVWINRCGVLAGAGQFGKAEQGIFSFWIHSWAARRPLRYLGFGGSGRQVRDVLHPRDLVPLLLAQIRNEASSDRPRIVNLAGGLANSLSLQQLSTWCEQRFGAHGVLADEQTRRFDLPWMVLDCALAGKVWDWRPATSLTAILEEIAEHAEKHPGWLDLSEP